MTGKFSHTVWVTGLSAAGKTTIALELQKQFKVDSIPCVLLDGDQLRAALNDPKYGYDQKSRMAGAYKYSRLSQMISQQGFVVIVSTISMYHEIRKFNRSNISNYFEVFVEADDEIRRIRDPKKLYKNNVDDMVGVKQEVEFPINPHVTISNQDHNTSPYKHSQEIYTKWKEHFKCVE